MAGWLTKRLEEKKKAATAEALKAEELQILPVERKSEIQLLQEENEWLKMILRDCENRRVNVQKKRIVDMTRPQPCEKIECLSPIMWHAKLSEKLDKIKNETLKLSQIIGTDSDEIHKTEARIATKLTELVTICTSWLHYGLMYDEHLRGNLQKRVNEKNLRHGSIRDDDILPMQHKAE